MKLHFEPDLDYQRQAIEAVCDLFRGQEICRTEFTVTKQAVGGALLPGMDSDLGVGNRLTLLDDQLRTSTTSSSATGWRRPPRWSPATSPWKWRPAPARPRFTCERSSS